MAHFIVYNTSDSTRKDAALTSAQSITVDQINTEQEGIIAGTVISDQAGTLYVDQGFAATPTGTPNWDYTATYTVTAGVGVKVSEAIIAPYARVRYTNGGVNQAYLRIFLRSFGTKTG